MSDRSLSNLTAVTNPTAGDLGYLVSGGNSRKIDLGTLLLKVPLTSVDNTVPRFDGLLGKLQSSGITIDDSNNILLPDSAIVAPSNSGLAALGSITKMWSGVFLAAGAVQNWNNGNITGTHAANSLTWAASGKSILQLAQNPAGDVGGTYLKLWPGNGAGQHCEFEIVSSEANAGLSVRPKGTNPFAIHAPVDQSASASLALYENELNGSNRMVFFAAASIVSSFSLIWPAAVPGANNQPLVCSTGGVLSFNTTPYLGAATGDTMVYGSDRAVRFNNQTSSAAAQTGTLTNAPAAGNPGFWLKINVGGTNYALPCWAG